MNLQPPLRPKDGVTIKVLAVARVSDPRPGKQDERSIDDQNKMHLKWLADNIGTNIHVEFLEGRESGEWLERKDYLKLIELVESGLYDLVLTEDIGRIIRRIHAHIFAETCVENNTRLISTNEHIDTSVPGWQDRSIFSAWHHERSNRDTSDRIKRSHRNRFDNGGCAQFAIYGYIKPTGSKNDADWRKDPAAEPIYREWFRKLQDQASYEEIADWLNLQNVPTGPHCRSDRWDGAMVGRVTHNTLLKGVRHRNRRKSKRNSKGRYVSVKAEPEELRTRKVPHLAFFEEAYYDEVVAGADARNSCFRRKTENGVDPRANVPKKRTRWPGQHLYCGVCGGMLLYGAHGQMDHLVCGRARDYRCWMGVSVDGAVARKKLLDALGTMLNDIPEFDPEIVKALEAEAAEIGLQARVELDGLDRELQRLSRERDNLLQYLRKHGDEESVHNELCALKVELAELQLRRKEVQSRSEGRVSLPSLEELRQPIREALHDVAVNSQDAARLLRRIISKIVVMPVRLLDGGKLSLRARFVVDLGATLPSSSQGLPGIPRLQRTLEVDLFDPPQREMHRLQIMALRAQGLSERAAAGQVGITVAAAQRAAKLQRLMDERGVTSPYEELSAPPAEGKKLSRHLHPRFKQHPQGEEEVPGAA